jgi:hypothetical protein
MCYIILVNPVILSRLLVLSNYLVRLYFPAPRPHWCIMESCKLYRPKPGFARGFSLFATKAQRHKENNNQLKWPQRAQGTQRNNMLFGR